MDIAPIDPTKIAAVGFAVLGCRDALNRLLGPTADYLGGELKGLVEKCNVNLDNVLRIGMERAGNRLDIPGAVNPRVFKQVVEEAVFCEDALVAEYLGGVLASARSDNGRDDRGVCFLADIKSLSVYQLRTHCLVYSALARFDGKMRFEPIDHYGEDGGEITVLFADEDYEACMHYGNREIHRDIAKHSFLGLESRGLSEFGQTAFLGELGNDVRFHRAWRYFRPTQYGHELFAWGLGLGGRTLKTYFDIENDQIPPSIPGIEVLAVESGAIGFSGIARFE